MCRGLWQGLGILWCAAGIILPIIYAEGLRRTFFPILAVTPQVPHTALPPFLCQMPCAPLHRSAPVSCGSLAHVTCPSAPATMVVLAGQVQAEQSAA